MTTSGPNQMHPHNVRGDDLYQTPPEAVAALLQHEQLPTYCWDPCCGPGNIAAALEAYGRGCYCSDLRVYPGRPMVQGDFLTEDLRPVDFEAIVMNPPGKRAAPFVARALEFSPHVYALLRLNWIAAGRSKYSSIYNRLETVLVFSRRLPMMHRAGWTGNKASSQIDWAWFCWGRSAPPAGTRIKRIDWRPADEGKPR
jgi:hypothetical protein